jgi:hypothetical protein
MKITKTTHAALAQPLRSWRLKMSMRVQTTRKIHTHHAKNHIIVRNTSSKG